MYLQKVISRKTFCWRLEGHSMTKTAGSGSESIWRRHGSADPDPHQNVMDPQHCCLESSRSVLLPLLLAAFPLSLRLSGSSSHSHAGADDPAVQLFSQLPGNWLHNRNLLLT
jgi:hypothetical protein